MFSQEQAEVSWLLIKGNRVEILVHLWLLLHRIAIGLSEQSTGFFKQEHLSQASCHAEGFLGSMQLLRDHVGVDGIMLQGP